MRFTSSKAVRMGVVAAATIAVLSATGVTSASASPAHRPHHRNVVVGMGDSYTSGQGAPPFVPGTDTDADQCHRAYVAYPVVAALETGAIPRNVACSGATTDDLFQEFKTEPAQVSRIGGATDIVLTIGGNDVDALGAISNPSTPEEFAAKLQALVPKLVATYQRIHAAAPKATIHVLGYPYLFSAQPQPGCVLSDATRASLLQAQAGLNQAIQAAAAAAGVEYIDDSTVFAGHEVCTDRPWVNGVVQEHPEYSFHPTARGHLALANLVAPSL